jgi:hypothetical protein
MSVNRQAVTKERPSAACVCSVSYQPKSQLLILEFPDDGAYLYRDVPVGAYERLSRSPAVRASFIRGRRHHYSVVTPA